SAVLSWVDATEVEAWFKAGETVRLIGRFSPSVPHARVTAAAFGKLEHKKGKTPKELQDLFGPPTEELKGVDDLAAWAFGPVAASERSIKRYGTRRVLEAFVVDGTVVAVRISSRPKGGLTPRRLPVDAVVRRPDLGPAARAHPDRRPGAAPSSRWP